MSKIAIFVEGQAEQIFSERFLREIAGQKDIRINTQRMFGGRRFPRTTIELSAPAARSGERYYALICDCGSDERVASEIRDQYESLIKSGYKAIIAIRDVYPFARQNISRLETGFHEMIKSEPVEVLLVLAVM